MDKVTFTYQIPSKSIGGFEIDCFVSEHIAHSNSVTDILVEDGDNIADHVIENADEIRIQAFIGRAVFQEWEGKLPENSSDIPAEDPKARIVQAYLELLRLKRERLPVDVVMGLVTFNNMVITSFEIDRSVETGADLPFEMTFKSVRIVKSETTTITAASTGPAGDQVAGSANMGTVLTKKVDPGSSEMQRQWKQTGEITKWRYPTKENYREECAKWGWVYDA